MVNINKLKAKLIENGLTVEDMANHIGVERSTMYRRMEKGSEGFTIADVTKLASLLNLTYGEINTIFFSEFVA